MLWSRLATDYQNDLNTREYNSMKHGLRVRPGGFELRVGLEETPGVAAPPENMKSLGASVYGSSFYVASPVEGAPSGRRDPHFRVRDCSLNWDAENVAHGIMMTALSIRNLQSFLKIRNGVDPKTVEFTRPVEDDHFDKPWARHCGPLSCDFHEIVSESDIQRLTEDEILARLDPPTSQDAETGGR